MRVQRTVLFALGGLMLLIASPARAQEPEPMVSADPAMWPAQSLAHRPLKVLGSASCGASNCHGGSRSPGTRGSEFTTWATLDPHRSAYAVLLNSRSVTIARNLKLPQPAHRSQACLVCHATFPADPEARSPDATAAFGVGCESCHGPAELWLDRHTTADWLALGWDSPEAVRIKTEAGMIPTKPLAGRAQSCTGCHVGAPGQEVDHDLIAAGHPRLNFEFAAYHAQWPRHWRSRATLADPRPQDKDRIPDFEARAWAVGQLVATRAALTLLQERAARAAEESRPWPELSEFDCFACHHDLRSPAETEGISWRQARGYARQRPGALAWGTWYTALTPQAIPHADSDLTSLLTRIEESVESPNPDFSELQQSLRSAVLRLDTQVETAEVTPVDPERTRELTRSLSADSEAVRDWDRAAQTLLALRALRRAERDLTGDRAETAADSMLLELTQSLRYPLDPRYIIDSPRDFTPSRVQELLERVHARLSAP